MSLYELIDTESAAAALTGGVGLTISDQCKLLDLSRSGYYRWLEGPKKKDVDEERKKKEMALVEALLKAYEEHPAFGYRKMSHYMHDILGWEDATEKRIRLLYNRLGIKGVKPVFKTTRAPKGKHLKFPYLLRGKQIAFVNQVWGTDITYIKLKCGVMVYLTAIIDLYSRKILAWRLSSTMETSFCIEVLHEAVSKWGIPAIFNTDCGSQYLSNEFISALQSYDIQISNDSVGRCLDNVFVERTWRSVKYECIFLSEWSTMHELEAGLEKYIRMFNEERPHEGLGYQVPDDVYRRGCFPEKEDSNDQSSDVA